MELFLKKDFLQYTGRWVEKSKLVYMKQRFKKYDTIKIKIFKVFHQEENFISYNIEFHFGSFLW